MKFYIHPINPNYSNSYLEDFNDGWHFGIWENPWPALESDHYRFQSRNLAAAEETQRQAQEASSQLPDIACEEPALVVPATQSLWGHQSQEVLGQAIREGRPVDWCFQDRKGREPAC